MQQTIIHVGLDVDDTQYQGSALDKTAAKPSISNAVRR